MSTSARAMAAMASPAEKAGPNCKLCGAPTRQRSDIDHRMFWAIVHRAFENWPEQHAFCATDANELYGWLLVEAEHSVSGEIQDRDINAIRKSARTFLDLAGESEHPIYYMRLTPTKKGVKVTIPKSLSYKTAGKRQFQDVRSRVYEIIESVLQTDVQTLKREARREAA